MEIAILIILLAMFGFNVIFQISQSFILIKIFEFIKTAQEEKNMEEEAKFRAKGLVDIATEQANYPLRLR